MFKPQLKRVLNELEGAAQGVEINLEDDPDIAAQAGTHPDRSALLRKRVKAMAGVQQRSEVKQAIEAPL